ncbi:MAG: EamA family transporter [Chloroflexi bacterium]|nr:EamA family transporter [Chloroflexota bacterium]
MMRGDPVTLAVFVLIVLIGGTNFVAVRFSNQELAPFWGAGIRFAAAGVLLLAIAALRHIALPRGRALVGAVMFGLLNFGAGFAFAYWGLVAAPAALGSVFVALAPLLTLLLARLHGLERLTWRGILGGAVAFLGVAVVFVDQLGAAVPLASVLALLAFALCVAESTVIAKVLPRVHPIATNATAMIPGSLLLLGLSLLVGEPRVLPTTETTWVALVYLATIGSIGLFVGFLIVVRRWTASATSYATVLFPIVTVAVGALLAGELASVAFVLGTVLVMAGVFVGAMAPAARKRVESGLVQERP